jgi:hypothetical protein
MGVKITRQCSLDKALVAGALFSNGLLIDSPCYCSP